MATNYIYLAGTAKWAKVFNSNIDSYDGAEFWSVELYPDADSLERFKASGSRVAIKTGEEGTFIRFRRPKEKLIKRELVTFEAPEVLDEHGAPWQFNGDGTPSKLIGNGSDVTIKIAVYDTAKGKGTRFEGIRVDRLEEYEANRTTLANVNVRGASMSTTTEIPF